jgi:hypothetical protein
VIKCLVQLHPDDAVENRLEQEAQIKALYDAAQVSGHELLLEVIPSDACHITTTPSCAPSSACTTWASTRNGGSWKACRPSNGKPSMPSCTNAIRIAVASCCSA